MTKRDTDIRSDDSVYVLLDTFHDRRTCYYVCTNLLGTQWDGRITENGRTFDATWDGIWKSAAQRTDFGWTAEFAIELSSIKYEPGENKTWGLSLGRGIPRKLEFNFWTGPLESAYKVSLFGELKGLNLKKAEKKLQIIPHIIAKAQEGQKSTAEVGLDARYAFSQTVSGNLTINPDFATVEADQEVINLTRFETYLPEKRNFFLEGSEIVADFDAWQARVQELADRDWDIPAIEARVKRLSEEGIQNKDLDSQELLSQKEQIFSHSASHAASLPPDPVKPVSLPLLAVFKPLLLQAEHAFLA